MRDGRGDGAIVQNLLAAGLVEGLPRRERQMGDGGKLFWLWKDVGPPGAVRWRGCQCWGIYK
jgi:hypothetical protein